MATASEDEPTAFVVAQFLLRSKSDSARWPDDSEFGDAWRSERLDTTLKRERLTMILRAMEGALRSPKHDPVPLPNSLHVEHLMPRSWKTNWPLPDDVELDAREAALHTIGNLTLLTGKLNQSLSDAPWMKKRSELQEFGLMALNAALAKYAAWDETTIRERGEVLLNKALTVWQRPASHYHVAESTTAESKHVHTHGIQFLPVKRAANLSRARANSNSVDRAGRALPVGANGNWDINQIPESNRHIINLHRRVDRAVENRDLATLEEIAALKSESTYYNQVKRRLVFWLPRVRAEVEQRKAD
jgi:Protein of unknown function (DUF1524)